MNFFFIILLLCHTVIIYTYNNSYVLLIINLLNSYRGIKFRILVSAQRLNTLIKMYSTSSGTPSDSSSGTPSDSSSDSSSDSDSDTEKVKKKKSVASASTKSLDSLVDNLMVKNISCQIYSKFSNQIEQSCLQQFSVTFS